MTAEEEELQRFLPHLELFHSECLYGVDHIPNVVSDIQNLPQTELAKVASGIQEVRRPRDIRLQFPLPVLTLVHTRSASIAAQ